MAFKTADSRAEVKGLRRDDSAPEQEPRKVMLDTSEEKTIREIWDGHGKYQWTYFSETVKQFIELHLEKRLSGRNLDVGGGWYLHYPNSDVVDISPVCLEYNKVPPERKHVFDLDSISRGARLPFGDGTFDSATMISVAQYLPDPWSVIKEVERVLKPGAELYVIGGEDAGITELIANWGFGNSKQVEWSFRSEGYDTITEKIPSCNGSTGAFSSVCVAMHDGKGGSHIRHKGKRLREAKSFSPQKFIEEYAEREASDRISRLRQLERYPVTKHSIGLLQRANDFSRELHERTGATPIIYCDSIRPEMDMALPGSEPFLSMAVVARDERSDWRIPKDMDYRGLSMATCCGYLPDTEGRMRLALRDLETRKTDDSQKSMFLDFAASVKVNDAAAELGAKMERSLVINDIGYLSGVFLRQAVAVSAEASQYKQRRDVDELIERKAYIESRPELIAGYGEFKTDEFVPYLRKSAMPRAQYSQYVD